MRTGLPSSLLLFVRSGGLLLLVLLLAATTGRAQIRVTGTVSDAADGKPLPGATVVVSSTGRGTPANDKGEFALTATSGDTLVFRSVGFQAQALPLGRTGLSQLVLQIRLTRADVLLGEVQVTEGRPDRTQINRALRNMRRPSTAPTSAVKRPPAPPPLFPVDSSGPKAPKLTVQSPVSLIYDQFSREGKQRRKLEELQAQERAEQARKARERYNRNFKDNRGYE